MVNLQNYNRIKEELASYKAVLVAVSKTKPMEDLLSLKDNGQQIFGENYVQELVDKNEQLSDVNWHFIGHLQSNKVKFISPFISLIHGTDSINLLSEINKQGQKNERVIDCLLQIHIASEETKFGFSYEEASQVLENYDLLKMNNIRIRGLMGMASNTEEEKKIRHEFRELHTFFSSYKQGDFDILSMGMTSDYKSALDEGSTMVRIGSAIFGERVYT